MKRVQPRLRGTGAGPTCDKDAASGNKEEEFVVGGGGCCRGRQTDSSAFRTDFCLAYN